MRLVNLLNGISKYGFRLQRYNKYLEYARISAIFGQKSPKMIQKRARKKHPWHAGDRDDESGRN